MAIYMKNFNRTIFQQCQFGTSHFTIDAYDT